MFGAGVVYVTANYSGSNRPEGFDDSCRAMRLLKSDKGRQ